jgi:hypothetical protein
LDSARTTLPLFWFRQIIWDAGMSTSSVIDACSNCSHDQPQKSRSHSMSATHNHWVPNQVKLEPSGSSDGQLFAGKVDEELVSRGALAVMALLLFGTATSMSCSENMYAATLWHRTILSLISMPNP